MTTFLPCSSRKSCLISSVEATVMTADSNSSRSLTAGSMTVVDTSRFFCAASVPTTESVDRSALPRAERIVQCPRRTSSPHLPLASHIVLEDVGAKYDFARIDLSQRYPASFLHLSVMAGAATCGFRSDVALADLASSPVLWFAGRFFSLTTATSLP